MKKAVPILGAAFSFALLKQGWVLRSCPKGEVQNPLSQRARIDPRETESILSNLPTDDPLTQQPDLH